MKILQIEDKEMYKLTDAEVVETLEEAKQKLKSRNYDLFIIDGNFPLNKGDTPGINAQTAIEYLVGDNVQGKVIVWTNSIRVQKYCEENNIICFSKNEKTEEHIKKMTKYGLNEYAPVRSKEDILK